MYIFLLKKKEDIMKKFEKEVRFKKSLIKNMVIKGKEKKL